jgi:hypothetical protein
MEKKSDQAAQDKEKVYHVSCEIGDPAIGAIRKGGFFEAMTPGEAAARFIDREFKRGDGKTPELLEIDRLKIERRQR